MMKPLTLLAISGSPRKKGNSVQFLADTLAVLPELNWSVTVTEYSFAAKKFSPCIGCLSCYKKGGECVFQDDFQELRELWVGADIILYAFPIYGLNMPGQMKCFLDRLGNAFYGYYPVSSVRHLKVIGALPQGGVSMGGQEISNLFVMAHAALMNSVYVSGDGAHVGSGAISGAGGNPNSFREKLAAEEPAYCQELAMARNMLTRMVEMAAILRSGALSLAETLAQDAHYGPPLQRMRKSAGEE